MDEQQLRELVASMSGVDMTSLRPETVLATSVSGSLGRARLANALRIQFGLNNPAIYQAVTFSDLCRVSNVGGAVAPISAEVDSAGPSITPPALISPRASSASIGTDIESITALPETSDFWEHKFYSEIFTQREIAYAQLQPSPRASLAGAWAAKEAVRKAVLAAISVDWTQIEIVHAPSGKPSVTLSGTPLGGSLSISHTAEVALATYIDIQSSPSPLAAPVAAGNVAPMNIAPPKPSRLPIILSLCSALMAAAALCLELAKH